MTAPVSLAKANDVFSLALFKMLSENDKTANIFYSPLSISSALSMVLQGAKGETYEEMVKVLGFSDGEQPGDEQEPPMQMQMQMQQQQKICLPPHLMTPPVPQENREEKEKNEEKMKEELRTKFGELLSELNKADAPYALSVANRLYGEKTFEFIQDFLDNVEKYYKAGLESVDFRNDAEGARVKINTWVEEKTQGKIKDLLAENTVRNSTKLMLVNAIYFKALWKEAFEKLNTIESDFKISKTATKKVKMMRQMSPFSYRDIPENRIKVLEMPYKSEDLSMIILLPNEIDDDTTGLEKLEGELTHQKFEEWTHDMKRGKVAVQIPKFKLTETYDLEEVLQAMGMLKTFTPVSDLSGISKTRGLFVSKVVHKAYVDVDEEGTEAAAATAIGLVRTSLPAPPDFHFTADHPFLFFIRHNATKSVLFTGRFCSPE